MARNQLIVQFAYGPPLGPRQWYEIEDVLTQAFAQSSDGFVDGNDIGQGRFNIFIIPRGSWTAAIERVKAFLKLRGALGSAVIVKLHGKAQRYEVVHPASFQGDFTL